MQRGSRGRGSAFCGANSPSACEPAAQLLELRQQVALAGHAQPRDRERERRRGGARARVVVAAAGDDHLRAVGERAEPQLVEVLAPHRARQRARRVAQLEPHLRPPGLEAEHLAEDLDAGEAAQAVAQRGRVVADGIGTRQQRAGDAVGRLQAGRRYPRARRPVIESRRARWVRGAGPRRGARCEACGGPSCSAPASNCSRMIVSSTSRAASAWRPELARRARTSSSFNRAWPPGCSAAARARSRWGARACRPARACRGPRR